MTQTSTPTPEELGIGWPFAELIEHALRADDARVRALAAAVAGDVGARIRADLERDDALADHHRVREDIAALFFLGFRCALELNSAAVAQLLAAMPVPRNVSDRLDQLEDAVLDLEAERQAVPR